MTKAHGAEDHGPATLPFRAWRALGFGVVALALLALAIGWRQAETSAALLRADPDSVLASPRLRGLALPLGRAVYAAECAACHGKSGEGERDAGVPDLRDGDWLYGEGRAAEIEQIVRYGIRSRNPKGWNLASMPAYASARPYAAEPIPPLTPAETDDVVQLLLRYEGRPADPTAARRGLAVYQKGGCWDCHGADGRGDPAVGAPNLRDAITLYGGSSAALTHTIERGRHGVSPAFAGRLDPLRIRAVAVYVASLAHSAVSAPKAAP